MFPDPITPRPPLPRCRGSGGETRNEVWGVAPHAPLGRRSRVSLREAVPRTPSTEDAWLWHLQLSPAVSRGSAPTPRRTRRPAARRAGGMGVSPINPLFFSPFPVCGEGGRGVGDRSGSHHP